MAREDFFLAPLLLDADDWVVGRPTKLMVGEGGISRWS